MTDFPHPASSFSFYDDDDDEDSDDDYYANLPWVGPPIKKRCPVVERKSAEEPWPPVWKSVEESPQYAEGLLDKYLDEWDFEKYDRLREFCPSFPFDHLDRSPEESHAIAKRFLQQVRQTRGYDVDCYPPTFMRTPFALAEWDGDEGLETYFKEMGEFAISEINAQAKKHCERYELVGVEKCVGALGNEINLLTLSVRQVVPCTNVVKTVQAMVNDYGSHYELAEWRFKPDQATSSSDSSCSPMILDLGTSSSDDS